jgi:hypothetical protein
MGTQESRRKVEQLQRIERLRKRLHELSAWRLALVQQEREKLATAHAEMLDALGDGLMAYGPASAAGTRRVRSIEREMALANTVEKTLESRALADGRLAKLAEGSLDSARETFRDQMERRSLEELIEATVASDTASRKP